MHVTPGFPQKTSEQELYYTDLFYEFNFIIYYILLLGKGYDGWNEEVSSTSSSREK